MYTYYIFLLQQKKIGVTGNLDSSTFAYQFVAIILNVKLLNYLFFKFLQRNRQVQGKAFHLVTQFHKDLNRTGGRHFHHLWSHC